MDLWGIDLGGTKIEGAVVDSDDPRTVRCRLRVLTEGQKGYEHILGQIARLIEQMEGAVGHRRPAAIGFGTPGAVEPDSGLMKNSNTVCLNGRTLRADLSRTLGAEARLANDANCFALAEALFGAARGKRVVFGVILGTGVGGGLVVDGHAWDGLHGIAGEWGHNPMRGESTPCYCGHVGCNEGVFSGPALEKFYADRAGTPLKLPEIAARAQTGDAAAQETLSRLKTKLGEALAVLINIVDPEAIVFGGGVGNLDLIYSDEMRAAVLAHLFNQELKTAFLRPTLGDSAGVFGAALLAR
ncbi:MAG TPA: ROK family protein [Opitutaceae bacterium]|jgi:predicted NBD/HSP70 family sugar kinase